MKRWLHVLAAAVLVTAGCGKEKAADNITWVESSDPGMNVAIDKARATSGDFIRALKSPKPEQTGFALKMPFSDGDITEHMWVGSLSYDGQSFHGVVDNEPAKLTNVKLGQKVTVAPDKISDWMYVENGKLVGGHTLRAMRDAMSAEERVEFDNNLPFALD